MIAADLPTSSRAHLNHATALQDAGRVDEAAEAFSNSLRLNADSAKAHVGLATILTGKGELDEAHKHYETALKMDPDNAEYHSGYAYLLEQLGHDEQACRGMRSCGPPGAEIRAGSP
jgi:Tfp pilus assembly protein PilF